MIISHVCVSPWLDRIIINYIIYIIVAFAIYAGQ